MIRDIDGGMTAATRLAGGAPLETTLDVSDPGDWLALDAAVREVAWYRQASKPGGQLVHPRPVRRSRGCPEYSYSGRRQSPHTRLTR